MPIGYKSLTRKVDGAVEQYCQVCGSWKNQDRDFGVRRIRTKIGRYKERPNNRCRVCAVSTQATVRARRGRHATPLTMRVARLVADMVHSHPGTRLRSLFIRQLYKQQNGKCYYTGIEMLLTGKRSDPLLMSVEKLDPALGYVDGNVVLCCLGMNCLKGQHTVDDMYRCLKLFADGAKNLGKI